MPEKPRAPLKAPHPRHNAQTVKQKTVAKTWNTVYLPGADVKTDTNAINAGKAERIEGEWHVNNRIYGEHDGILYPIKGEGFIRMSRDVFQSFGMYNQFGDTDRVAQILRYMGKTKQVIDEAYQAWQQVKEAETMQSTNEDNK